MFHFRRPHGFSLLECLITLAIIAILSTLAIPSYLRFSKRAFYSELVQATAPYQFGVALCVQTTGDFKSCDSGVYNIPDAIVGSEHIASLTVHHGVIRVVPEACHGISKQDTYMLTPSLTAVGIVWHSSGGAVQKGYAH